MLLDTVRAAGTGLLVAGLMMLPACGDDAKQASPSGGGGSGGGGSHDDGGPSGDGSGASPDGQGGASEGGSIEAGPRCIRMPCPVVLASGVATSTAIAVDGTYVYWTDLGKEERVHRVPKGGGATSLIGGWQYDVPDDGIVTDGKNVYWTLTGAIMKVSVDNTNLVTLFDNVVQPEKMAVDATSVYWVEPAGGLVQQIPIDGVKDGGAALTLFTRQNLDDEPVALAVDSSSVYFAVQGGFSGGAIMKVPIGGGTPVTLAALTDKPLDLAIDGTNIYFSTLLNEAIMKLPLDGGTPAMLAKGSGQRIAVDASYVYWTDIVANLLMRAPLAGGAPEALAGGRGMAIALDATNLYWIDYGVQSPDVPGGFVVSLAK
jgi:hypothetical protein